MSDFDDLLGGDEPEQPAGRKRGRPSNADRAARAAEMLQQEAHRAEIRAAGRGAAKIAPEEFLLPVSQNWLGRVLNMDPMTVKKRLSTAPVKPAGTVGNGRPVYYFHEALPYLMKPKMDLATYLKTLNPGDMPNSINKVFWEAERIKNKTLIETGEAWPTHKVVEVLGSIFMMIKDRIPLIKEALREMNATDAQNTKLEEMCDQFQGDLHAALVEMPKQRRTYSRAAEIDPMDGPAVADDVEFEEE